MKHLMNEKVAKLTRRGMAFLLAAVLMTSAFVPGLTARATEDPTDPVVVTDPTGVPPEIQETESLLENFKDGYRSEDGHTEEEGVEEGMASAEETTAPTEATTVPTEETTVPTEETTVPTEEATVPTEETTVPDEDNDDIIIEDADGSAEPQCTCFDLTMGHEDDCPLFGVICGICGEEDCICSVVSLFNEVDFLGADGSDSGTLKVNKYVTEGENLGEYTLHLEAYVTGQISSVSSPKPTDIIVAFDHSGSMLRALNDTKLTKNQLSADKGKIEGYYVSSTDTHTVFLYYKNKNWYYVQETRKTKDVTNYGPLDYNTTFSETKFNSGTLVTEALWKTFNKNGIYQTRYGAAYDALMGFVERTAATGVDHRIAIVTFAGSNGGTGMYVNGNFKRAYAKDNDTDLSLTKADYQKAFMSFSDKGTIIDCVESIYSGWGSTFMNVGLDMAYNIFANSSSDRDKMVIVLNDGIPNYAPESIAAAEKIKDKKGWDAKIYSIGCLADTEAKGKAILERVSSNYSDATAYNDGTPVASKYYVNASNPNAMNDMFDKIITDTSGTAAQLNAQAVLKDNLTNYFDLDTSREVKVYTADCTGKSGDNYTFATPVEWAQGTSLSAGETLSVTINPATNSQNQGIFVNGFDYSKNYVAVSGDQKHGKKLILEVPIKIDSDNDGGTKQPTNVNSSGVYPNASATTASKYFPVPYADTPAVVHVVKEITGNMADINRIFDFSANGSYYSNSNGHYYTDTPGSGTESNWLKCNSVAQTANFELGDGNDWRDQDTTANQIDHYSELLVAGSKLTITETTSPNYKVTILVNGEEVERNSDGSYEVTVEPGMTVTFINDNSVTIDTGISLDSIPYIVILAGVAAAVAFLFLRKRRVEE